MKNKNPWLIYALITTLTWGVWGAIMEFPAQWGFPDTLGYITWSLTMIPCALVALKIDKWNLQYDFKSIFLGSCVGFLGAGGQLLLFRALREGPAYIIFPVISLYPVLTIVLSVLFLKEKVNLRGKWGIGISLLAILLLSYSPPTESDATSSLWLWLSMMIFVMWGLQAYVMKFSNQSMSAESIFFYMTVSGLLLSPIAYAMTDFSQTINWGFSGPYGSFMIQSLNALGALFLVYALRFGKAIIVVPMTSLAPVITIIISLVIYTNIPNPVVMGGMGLASLAIYLLAVE